MMTMIKPSDVVSSWWEIALDPDGYWFHSEHPEFAAEYTWMPLAKVMAMMFVLKSGWWGYWIGSADMQYILAKDQ